MDPAPHILFNQPTNQPTLSSPSMRNYSWLIIFAAVSCVWAQSATNTISNPIPTPTHSTNTNLLPPTTTVVGSSIGSSNGSLPNQTSTTTPTNFTDSTSTSSAITLP